MTDLQNCDSVWLMTGKKRGATEIIEQESIRFSDLEERRRLNDVLRDLRSLTDGTINKQRFLKALIGLPGYELRNLTDRHRAYIAGEGDALHGTFPAIPKASGTNKAKSGTR